METTVLELILTWWRGERWDQEGDLGIYAVPRGMAPPTKARGSALATGDYLPHEMDKGAPFYAAYIETLLQMNSTIIREEQMFDGVLYPIRRDRTVQVQQICLNEAARRLHTRIITKRWDDDHLLVAEKKSLDAWKW